MRVDRYFLTWMDSSPIAKFLPEPLSEFALDTIIHDIRVVITTLKQHLLRGPFSAEADLWSLFACGQQVNTVYSQPQRTLAGCVTGTSLENTPLDLSVKKSGNSIDGF